MSKFDPRTILSISLIPTLILFLAGSLLLVFAFGTELATPVFLIGGGLLAGFALTKRFGDPKSKP